jgi:hypothetical protein
MPIYRPNATPKSHQNQELETRAASRGLGSEGVQQRVGAPSLYRPSGLSGMRDQNNRALLFEQHAQADFEGLGIERGKAFV